DVGRLGHRARGPDAGGPQGGGRPRTTAPALRSPDGALTRPPPSAGSSSAPCVRRGTTRAPSRPRDPTPRTGTTARGRKWAMNGQEAAPPVAIVGLDEDMVFQRREWRWQRVGRVAVAVFVLAACL